MVIEPPMTTLKPRSTLTPPFSQYTNIEIFVEMVTKDLKKIHPNKERVSSNLNVGEKEA